MQLNQYNHDNFVGFQAHQTHLENNQYSTLAFNDHNQSKTDLTITSNGDHLITPLYAGLFGDVEVTSLSSSFSYHYNESSSNNLESSDQSNSHTSSSDTLLYDPSQLIEIPSNETTTYYQSNSPNDENTQLQNENIYVPKSKSSYSLKPNSKAKNKVNKKLKEFNSLISKKESSLDRTLSLNIIEFPKYVVQNGAGIFKIEVKGQVNFLETILVARPTNPIDFQLDSFCSSIPEDGIVSMKIKFSRGNGNDSANSIQINFKLVETESFNPLVEFTSQPIMFCNNTKDLPNPTILSYSLSLESDHSNNNVKDSLIYISVRCDRLKYGTSVKLSFFILDNNNTVLYIVKQKKLAKPEPTKTYARFAIPTRFLDQDNKLIAHYVSKTKTRSKYVIRPISVGQKWTHSLHGSVII